LVVLELEIYLKLQPEHMFDEGLRVVTSNKKIPCNHL